MRWILVLAVLAPVAGCKDPDRQAAEQTTKTWHDKVQEGRELMDQGLAAQAANAFKEASAAAPEDPLPLLLLAEALREAGNDGAAILAMKQAAQLSDKGDEAVRRQLIELYRRSGNSTEAIRVLQTLQAKNELKDDEVLLLAHLQAEAGRVEDAFKTLEVIQKAHPDDPDAKVVEAEALMLSGDELLAAKLMDRLVSDAPHSAPVRALRARYFLSSGLPDIADKELAEVPAPASSSADIVILHARVLNALRRGTDAEAALSALIDREPRNADALGMMAETELMLGKADEAHAYVEKALALRPRSARALYVRGRAFEAQGDGKSAADNYEQALQSDPSFAPALSRVWPIYLHQGNKLDAMTALEKLFFMREATIAEKAQLADLYAQHKVNVNRGRKLIAQAIEHDPVNGRYKSIRDALAKLSSGTAPKGPIILRRGR